MRCAIYTRKSTQEGLEQDFNSLHAQREACEAYIKSQRFEGWTVLQDPYDDGGISGGTMERPALQQLLQDVRSGKVDIVVVYKVDRLTRSLADFAKIIEIFDQRSVSFVSVTQAFNTTSSMGRLTLNVLLSFAQFEREVTGERIRDKIAASKKKGMWMGGNVPLGYDVKDRKLIINDADAAIVRDLFRLYIELGSTRSVHEQATRRGFKTARRITKAGRCRGGHPLSRGHIDQILTSRVYIGDIPHKGQSYPGQHAAILDTATWEETQTIRKRKSAARRCKTNVKVPSLLGGLLYDAGGAPLTPTHAVKAGKRYRYYVSRTLITGDGAGNAKPVRLPAADMERLTLTAIAQWLKDAGSVIDALAGLKPGQNSLELAEQAACFTERLTSMPPGEQANTFSKLCTRITVHDDHICIALNSKALLNELGVNALAQKPPPLTLKVPARLCRVGGESRILTPEDETRHLDGPDPAILRALARAHDWAQRLTSEQVHSITQMARQDGVGASYLTRILPLGFLAPEIVERLIRGEHSTALTAEKITRGKMMGLSWKGQIGDLLK